MKQSTRREFLTRASAVSAAGAAGLFPHVTFAAPMRARRQDSTVRVLSIGVIGTIGGTDRKQVSQHPSAEIVGLCDIDSESLAKAQEDHPNAFAGKDYREVFADHADEFDAVIVSTPDHSHAPIMLTALAHGKHVYGQKPLVHQLEEVAMIEAAMAARPELVTQVGNQRMVFPGRRAAVEILRSGALGKAIAGYAWTGSPSGNYYFNIERELKDPSKAPAHIDFDLWLGPAKKVPYRELMMPRVWRSWWNYGTGGLGDWGVHVLDVIYFGFDELTNPVSVVTHAPNAADDFHPFPCRSTVTYAVDSDRFANAWFPIYYSDRGQAPSRAALGIGEGKWPESNMTVVQCEGGVLVLSAGGKLEIWRDGQVTDGLEMPGLPEFPELNHWHAWVDNILGLDTELRTPFVDGARITEGALLAVKATRYPGAELRWNKAARQFTNHEEANTTIVRRDYRDGFAPPAVT